MAFVALPVAAAVGAWWYRRGPGEGEGEDQEQQAGAEENNEDGAEGAKEQPKEGKEQPKESKGDYEEGALISKPKKSDGYVFGDVWSRRWFSSADDFDAGAELETQLAAKAEPVDERFDKVERLVRDAVVLYRARGYNGTISISQRVGVFTESASVSISESDAPTAASNVDAPAGEADDTKRKANAKAGRVFHTLFSRLERRAIVWQRLSGVEGLDPMLSESAQIGFAMPVVNVGWGVSVTFSVKRSTLVTWLERAAAEPEEADYEEEVATESRAMSMVS